MTDFISAAKAGDVAVGAMKAVVIDGADVAIANVGGDYFAFGDRCTCVPQFAGHIDVESGDGHQHLGERAHLSDGALDGDRVTCPHHSTVYSVKTGKPLGGPGEIPLNTYEMHVEGGELLVAAMPDALRHFVNDPGNRERP